MSNYFLFFVQIIIESLPISSSGHRVLTTNFLNYINVKVKPLTEEENYFLHLPNVFIISLFVLVNASNLLSDICYVPFYFSSLIFVANLITGFFYFLFKKIDISKISINLGFFITAFLLYGTYLVKPGNDNVNLTAAISIGITQGLSLLPGISRLGSTYAIGYYLGIDPKTSFIFSLLVQLPLMLAGILKALYTCRIKNINIKVKILNIAKDKNYILILILTIISSVISYKLLCLVLDLAIHNKIYYFGVYLFILSTILFLKKIWRCKDEQSIT